MYYETESSDCASCPGTMSASAFCGQGLVLRRGRCEFPSTSGDDADDQEIDACPARKLFGMIPASYFLGCDRVKPVCGDGLHASSDGMRCLHDQCVGGQRDSYGVCVQNVDDVPCKEDEYEVTPQTRWRARQCAPLTKCDHEKGEVETVAPRVVGAPAVSDRVCENCPSDHYYDTDTCKKRITECARANIIPGDEFSDDTCCPYGIRDDTCIQNYPVLVEKPTVADDVSADFRLRGWEVLKCSDEFTRVQDDKDKCIAANDMMRAELSCNTREQIDACDDLETQEVCNNGRNTQGAACAWRHNEVTFVMNLTDDDLRHASEYSGLDIRNAVADVLKDSNVFNSAVEAYAAVEIRGNKGFITLPDVPTTPIISELNEKLKDVPKLRDVNFTATSDGVCRAGNGYCVDSIIDPNANGVCIIDTTDGEAKLSMEKSDYDQRDFPYKLNYLPICLEEA